LIRHIRLCDLLTARPFGMQFNCAALWYLNKTETTFIPIAGKENDP